MDWDILSSVLRRLHAFPLAKRTFQSSSVKESSTAATWCLTNHGRYGEIRGNAAPLRGSSASKGSVKREKYESFSCFAKDSLH